MTKQYTLVTKTVTVIDGNSTRPNNGNVFSSLVEGAVGSEKEKDDTNYTFHNFHSPSELISRVSNISKGDTTRVHKIFTMDHDGNTIELTIGFNNGLLDLIVK